MLPFLATFLVLSAGLALLAWRFGAAGRHGGCAHCGRPAGEHCADHGRPTATGACAGRPRN
jgi:hypothetical protein